jgi:hypothetical protein
VFIKINNKNNELNKNIKLKKIEKIVKLVKCADQVNFKTANIKAYASLFFTNINIIDNKKTNTEGIIHMNNSFLNKFMK